jgi:hypothetical protein
MSANSLSSWAVASGVSWIQTTEPRFARKLAKRSDTRLVAVGVAGGFLRIFVMRRSPAFMRRLIARYEAANERFRGKDGAQQCAKRGGKAMTADSMI